MLDDFTITNSTNEYELNVDIRIEDEAWKKAIANDLNKLVIESSQHIFVTVGLNKHVKHIEFSLTLTDSHNIQKLNAQYRGKDAPTNSLSFPAQELIPEKLDKYKFHDGFAILGDIILAYDVVASEAITQNKSFYNHFAHLLVHGVLHLLGYDHIIEEDAIKMEALEVEILSFLEIKSPYE